MNRKCIVYDARKKYLNLKEFFYTKNNIELIVLNEVTISSRHMFVSDQPLVSYGTKSCESLNYNRKIDLTNSCIEYIFVGHQAPRNYFHWLIQSFASCFHQSSFKCNVKFVFYKLKNWQKAILEVFGFSNDNILELDWHGVYYFEKISLYTSCFKKGSFSPSFYKNHYTIDSLYYRAFVDCAKQLCNSKISSNKIDCHDDYGLIYLSRKNISVRSILNEDELEASLVEQGFKVIYPEELSFLEQVNIFSNAKVIISSSGSALTNVVFCNQDVILILLYKCETNIEDGNWIYFTLSNGLTTFVYVENDFDFIVKRGRYDFGDWNINVSRMVNFSRAVLQARNSITHVVNNSDIDFLFERVRNDMDDAKLNSID